MDMKYISATYFSFTKYNGSTEFPENKEINEGTVIKQKNCSDVMAIE